MYACACCRSTCVFVTQYYRQPLKPAHAHTLIDHRRYAHFIRAPNTSSFFFFGKFQRPKNTCLNHYASVLLTPSQLDSCAALICIDLTPDRSVYNGGRVSNKAMFAVLALILFLWKVPYSLQPHTAIATCCSFSPHQHFFWAINNAVSVAWTLCSAMKCGNSWVFSYISPLARCDAVLEALHVFLSATNTKIVALQFVTDWKCGVWFLDFVHIWNIEERTNWRKSQCERVSIMPIKCRYCWCSLNYVH